MRLQLKNSPYRIFNVIGCLLLISACSRTNPYANNYAYSPTANQQIIPTLDPFANGSIDTSGTSSNLTIAAISVSAAPSSSASVGSVIYLFASSISGNSYNFQFSSNSIGASFVGTSSGVQQVGVTSSNPGSVTITASPLTGTLGSGSITLNFTGSSSGPTPIPPVQYSSCSIQGPYAISNYYNQSYGTNPQVGSSYYFTVQRDINTYYGYPEQLKIINVWTQDPSEVGRYYNSWSNFWMTFNSAGQKMIYVRAQSLTSGSICDAQISINVSSGSVSNGSCGLPSPYPGTCNNIWAQTGYYYNGSSCVQAYQPCTTMPFQTLYQCQQAVAAGQCGGSSGDGSVNRQISVDSRSTQWMDTGVDVSPTYNARLIISASGQVAYTRVGNYSGPAGVTINGYNSCKVSNGQSYNNVALLGKIGVNGTPFLVGSYLNSSITYSTGRLYLIVNDSGCASDNSGSFTANIQYQSGVWVY